MLNFKVKNDSDFFVFINTLKKSFMELLAYVIFFSIIIISKQMLDYFMTSDSVYSDSLDALIAIMSNFLPILLMINVSINFARIKNVNIAISITSSLLIYILFQLSINEYEFIFENGLSIYTLSIPYLSILLIKYFKKLNIFESYFDMNYDLKDIFSYLIPFLITILVSTIILIITKNLLAPLVEIINTFLESLPELIFMPLYIMFGHLFWFIGIHGNHISLMFFDESILNATLMPNLTNTNFRDLFTVFGGAGSGLALVIAILINGKDMHWNKISKISLPFVIFNINEILIYGLPIIFNKYLFFPFIFVPIINFFIAYYVLSLGYIEFIIQDVHWAIPIFLNSYIATDGNMLALLLQFILLIVSIFIYLPFVNMYVKQQDKASRIENLSSSLGVSTSYEKSKIKKEHEQLKIITKNVKINEIINLLHENKLLVYFQPKVDIKNDFCYNFEALLRLEFSDGKIVGPYFLEELEDDGLAPIIDLWVCKAVKQELEIWKKDKFKPTVGINIHPDTLKETDVILQIIDMFIGFNVEFEILERAFVDNDVARDNVELIKSHGFQLSIDDFGTGYTSLDTLYDTPCSTVKLDKSLIDLIVSKKGYIICSVISELCNKLGFDIVAEGVEEKEQFNIIKTMNIKYIQGYYFSPAMPANEVQNFVKEIKVKLGK